MWCTQLLTSDCGFSDPNHRAPPAIRIHSVHIGLISNTTSTSTRDSTKRKTTTHTHKESNKHIAHTQHK